MRCGSGADRLKCMPPMIAHPNIDSVAFYIFDWPVRWYGLMYLLAFAAAFFLGRRLLRRAAFADLRRVVMDDMLLAGVIGVIGGGRLGYVLFYNPAFYADNLDQVARLWDGGMSFHGGLLGVIFALYVYARRCKLPFLRMTDFAAVLTPIGLGLGRIGNFINGELPGRVASADLPWAMIFPGDSIARHPSSLYQAFLEGAVLFVVLQFFAARRRPPGFLSGVFLIGYALCRIFSELFREPDAHLGFIIGGMSMGQLLSFPMLLGGIALLMADKWIPVAKRACTRIFSAAVPAPAVAGATNMPPPPAEDFAKMLPPVPVSPPDADADVAAEVKVKDDSGVADETEVSEVSEIAEEEEESAERAEEEEREEELEKGATSSAAAASSSISWWKKIFAAKKETEETVPLSRRLSRRDTRRQKKKRRR